MTFYCVTRVTEPRRGSRVFITDDLKQARRVARRRARRCKACYAISEGSTLVHAWEPILVWVFDSERGPQEYKVTIPRGD